MFGPGFVILDMRELPREGFLGLESVAEVKKHQIRRPGAKKNKTKLNKIEHICFEYIPHPSGWGC